MLKSFLVAHLTYENHWGWLRTKIRTFGFFWDTLMHMDPSDWLGFTLWKDIVLLMITHVPPIHTSEPF